MAVTNLESTGAGSIWNQWTPSGTTFSTQGNIANKQTFTFQDPATYLSASATITQVQLTVTWATASGGNGIVIYGSWSPSVQSAGTANTNLSGGAMTSVLTIVPPASIGAWTLATLSAMEIGVYASVPATANSSLMSVVVGPAMYLTVTDTSVPPPGTESESILLIL